MDKVEKLQAHNQRVRTRTVLSIGLFVLFLCGCVVIYLRHSATQDPETILTLAGALGAMIILPRDYLPSVLLLRAEGSEAELWIERLRSQQRLGMYLRIIYIVLAVLAIVVIPRLAAITRGGGG